MNSNRNSSRRSRRPTALSLVLLPLLLFGLACVGGEPWPTDLEVVEHPPLDAMERAAAEQITASRDKLEALSSKGRGETRDLADAYGDLGEIYHAYELRAAAGACYRNAQRLDAESFLWPYYLGLNESADGRVAEASAHFRRALELRPENEPAKLHLGDALLADGKAEEARALFEPLVDVFDYRAAARYGLGRALALSGDHAAAVEQFQGALRAQPEAGVIHHALGNSLRRAGDEEAALAHLEEKGSGEVSFPDRLAERIAGLAQSSGTFLRRANKALLNGEMEEALGLYQEALEIAPENVEVRRNYAIALSRDGSLDQAITQLKEAVELAPDDAGLHFDLGNNQLAKRFGQQAEESFKKAIELAPDMTRAHFNLANLLTGQERWSEAVEPLKRVLELEPDDARAGYLLAICEHNMGRTQAAMQRLRKQLEADPGNLTTRRGLATIHNDRKRPAEALRVLDQGLSYEMDDEERLSTLFELAELAWRVRQREQAVDYSRSAVELAPESSDAYTRLANILQVKGEREEAAELFARAIELDPENATARLSEGSLLILMGRFIEARESLEAAHAAHPKDLKIQHTLARLLATSPDSAVRDGMRALELSRDVFAKEGSMDHSATVAMALAEMGEYEKAYLWQEGLVRQATMAGMQQNVLRQLVEHLRLYENQRPLRVAP